MADNKFSIKIQAILGGHSALSHYAGDSQFRSSLGIDPSFPISDTDTALSIIGSGLLRPVPSEKFSGTTITSAPLWILNSAGQDQYTYVYDANGSAYTIDATFSTVAALSDAGALSRSLANGLAFYDSHMYFAKNTTITRYGNIFAGPTMTDAGQNFEWWTNASGLNFTTLTHPGYDSNGISWPTSYLHGIQYPNHILHRHSDGRLYVGDILLGEAGNRPRGTLHYVETVTGTNSNSTYDALTFPERLYPSAIASHGTDLMIALYEGNVAGNKEAKAKIAIWDTVSTTYNRMIWDEFPDTFISALKNVNGTMYIISGNISMPGFRVSRYIGANSFQEVFYSETGELPFPGAVDAVLNRLGIGTFTRVPESYGCVYGIGLQKASLGQGVFNVMVATGATGSTSSTTVTAVSYADNTKMGFYTPIIGWTSGPGEGANGLDKQGTTYGNTPSVFWSPVYRLGQPFRITKIRIPLAQAVAANMTITPKIYLDDGVTSSTLTTIDNTNYPNSERNIVIRPDGLTGEHNFWLELRWTGSALAVVNLPISIEGEYVGDQ